MAAEPSSEPSQPDSKTYGRDDLIELIRCSDAANEWGDRLAALEFLVGALAIEPDNEGIWRCLAEVVQQSAPREACVARLLEIASGSPGAPGSGSLIGLAREVDGLAPVAPDVQGAAIGPAAEEPPVAPRTARSAERGPTAPKRQQRGNRTEVPAPPVGPNDAPGPRGRTDSDAQPAGGDGEPAGGRRGAGKGAGTAERGKGGRRRKQAPTPASPAS